nr:hypothetical protein B0A51_16330 [Rachicladosporium sp. CCFEE 5018]
MLLEVMVLLEDDALPGSMPLEDALLEDFADAEELRLLEEDVTLSCAGLLEIDALLIVERLPERVDVLKEEVELLGMVLQVAELLCTALVELSDIVVLVNVEVLEVDAGACEELADDVPGATLLGIAVSELDEVPVDNSTADDEALILVFGNEVDIARVFVMLSEVGPVADAVVEYWTFDEDEPLLARLLLLLSVLPTLDIVLDRLVNVDPPIVVGRALGEPLIWLRLVVRDETGLLSTTLDVAEVVSELTVLVGALFVDAELVKPAIWLEEMLLDDSVLDEPADPELAGPEPPSFLASHKLLADNTLPPTFS